MTSSYVGYCSYSLFAFSILPLDRFCAAESRFAAQQQWSNGTADKTRQDKNHTSSSQPAGDRHIWLMQLLHVPPKLKQAALWHHHWILLLSMAQERSQQGEPKTNLKQWHGRHGACQGPA